MTGRWEWETKLACTGKAIASGTRPNPEGTGPMEAPAEALREVVRRHGTPTYAYDLGRIRAQAARLRDHLPPAIEIFYSLKANASLGLCGFLADCGLGADVASAGELVTAREAGFAPQRLLVTGPDRSPAVLTQLRSVPEAILSVDSLSELQMLAGQGLANRIVLRLRPDFRCTAACTAGPDSRFGLLPDDLSRCRDYMGRGGLRVVGFHVFPGSQVLDAAAVVQHLRGALDQSLRAADVLGLSPEVLDLGGGFGTPYGPEECELDLAPIGDELGRLVERAAPARIVMELGRYLVAQSGWYLTRVLALQKHGGRNAVVVDGGTHQRGDLCGIGLRGKVSALALDARPGPAAPTDVLGCLSHPGDVLAEASPLPPLLPGDLLAFPNAGAYTLGASPTAFHAHVAPAETAFDGSRLEPIRRRQPVASILDGQVRLGRPATSSI
jgi:diaminopimelate decarboxylase